MKIVENRNNPIDENVLKYFINKDGLEIGGISPIFLENGLIPIYNKMISLDGVNFPETFVGNASCKENFKNHGVNINNIFIMDTVDLSKIEKKYDFVICSNVIEHIANPLKAVKQWVSILKQGGVLLIIAPRKETNFDKNRDIVKFEHLIDDYMNDIKEDNMYHLEEMVRMTNYQASHFSYENRYLHHHCFDINILEKIYDKFNLNIIETYNIISDYIIIGQKNK